MAGEGARPEGDFSSLVTPLACGGFLVIVSDAVERLEALVEDPSVARTGVEESSDLLRRSADVNICHVGHIMIVEHLDAVALLWASDATRTEFFAGVKVV